MECQRGVRELFLFVKAFMHTYIGSRLFIIIIFINEKKSLGCSPPKSCPNGDFTS